MKIRFFNILWMYYSYVLKEHRSCNHKIGNINSWLQSNYVKKRKRLPYNSWILIFNCNLCAPQRQFNAESIYTKRRNIIEIIGTDAVSAELKNKKNLCYFKIRENYREF